ncbi:MAG: choice-of-anchor R domain-containing protein [Rhizomicrobium sp.]
MLRETALALFGLAFIATTAAAAPPGIELSKDHRRTIALNPAVPFTRQTTDDAGLVTIFDNIGSKYKQGTYWCCDGNTITGPGAMPGNSEWWMAGAFTPSANHTVTRIEVAAGHILGPNSITLSIAQDAGGVPGTVLKSWVVRRLPTFGGCCTLIVQADRTGVSVAAGRQYWIMLTTDAREADTWDTWEYNDTDQVHAGATAIYCSDDQGGDCLNNDQWTAESYTPALAFAVKGE